MGSRCCTGGSSRAEEVPMVLHADKVLREARHRLIYEPALCSVEPRLEKPADQNLREISQKKKKSGPDSNPSARERRRKAGEETGSVAQAEEPESEGRRRKQRRKSARGTEGEFSRSASSICFSSELFSFHVKGRQKKTPAQAA